MGEALRVIRAIIWDLSSYARRQTPDRLKKVKSTAKRLEGVEKLLGNEEVLRERPVIAAPKRLMGRLMGPPSTYKLVTVAFYFATIKEDLNKHLRKKINAGTFRLPRACHSASRDCREYHSSSS